MQTGSFSFRISVEDADNIKVFRDFTLLVTNLDITTTSLTDWAADIEYPGVILTAQGGTGIYTWTIEGGALPTGLNLSPAGSITGTPTEKGIFTFRIQVADEDGITTTRIFTIIISDLVITTENIPVATNGIAYTGVDGGVYNATISATGGEAPYTWSWSAPGLTNFDFQNRTIVDNATITEAPGSYQVTISVKDSNGIVISKDFSLTITDLGIVTTTLATGIVGQDYSDTLQAVGGSLIYEWTILAGSLPSGLSLDSVSGEISGNPTAKGTVSFIVQVTDTQSNLSTTKLLSIDVSDLEITTVEDDIPVLSIGNPVSIVLTATGGDTSCGGYTWSVPNWDGLTNLNLNAATGTISNFVPVGTVERRYTGVTVAVTDCAGITVTKTFDQDPGNINTGFRVTSLFLNGGQYTTITIGDGASYVLPMTQSPTGTTAAGTYGGGSLVYEFDIVGGGVPAGMTLGKFTGLVSGVPTTHGLYTWRLQVTDPVSGISVEDSFAVQIIDPSLKSTSAGGSTFCFIATAAYGSYLDHEVVSLRRFRDNYLLSSALGRAAVSFYYRNSPPVAEFIARHDALRLAARLVITPIAYAARFPMPIFGIVFFAGAVALTARTRKRKA
jgi:hypothetical protein